MYFKTSFNKILRVTRCKWQLLSLQFLNVTEHDINLIFVVYSLDQAQVVWEFANSPVKELGGKKKNCLRDTEVPIIVLE